MKTNKFVKQLISFCKKHNVILVDGNRGIDLDGSYVAIPFVDEEWLMRKIEKEKKCGFRFEKRRIKSPNY